MAMKRILCIFRAACFSPGMVERDEAILRAVAERLEGTHYTVEMIHEELFTPDTPMPDIVLHMTRSPRALEILNHWETAGCRVLNSVESICGVEREALAMQCVKWGIPTPTTWIISTASSLTWMAETTEKTLAPITFPCWMKRTGACAQHPEDVCFVPDAEAYCCCLSRFRTRGIDKVVVMEHLEGTAVKFYGVQGSDFFYSLSASQLGYDKWTDRSVDTQMPSIAPDTYSGMLSHIRELFKQTRKGLPVIYGGDAIIGPDGIARLIDLNDWPSFSACREEAADAIVRLVTENTGAR